MRGVGVNIFEVVRVCNSVHTFGGGVTLSIHLGGDLRGGGFV